MLKVFKWVMRAHFRHLRSKKIPMIWINIQYNGFWPLQSFSEDSEVHQDSNSQSGSSLGSVKVHSFILSYTPKNMKCDSWASLLARTLASPCFGHEPKARVATWFLQHDWNPKTFFVWSMQWCWIACETLNNAKKCFFKVFFMIKCLMYKWFLYHG
jgi:hypothetical protein